MSSRWHKLAALADDPRAPLAERQTARRLLCELDARTAQGQDPKRVVFSGLDGWQFALLCAVARGCSVSISIEDGVATADGDIAQLDVLVTRYAQAVGPLQHVVDLAVAGWLAVHCPSPQPATGARLKGPDRSLALAAGQSRPPGRPPTIRPLPVARAPLALTDDS